MPGYITESIQHERAALPDWNDGTASALLHFTLSDITFHRRLQSHISQSSSQATPTSSRLKMVSARPAPKVVGGRTAYPTYQTYTPGEAGEQPESTSPRAIPINIAQSPPNSDGIERVMSNESDKAGLMTWFKGFRDRSASEPQRMGMFPIQEGGRDIVIIRIRLMLDTRSVFGVPLSESIEYASVQISTAGPDDALYVWG